EGEMPRPRTWRNTNGRRIVLRESSLGRIEQVNEQSVETQVSGDAKAVRRVEVDRVSMRALLAAGVGAGTRVLLDVRGRSESAALLDRQHGEIPPTVVRHQHDLAGRIDDQMTGRSPFRGSGVQRLQ